MERNINRRSVEWIDELFKAWRSKNLVEIAHIFEHCQAYMEDPFLPVQHPADGILGLWQEVQEQDRINLSYEVLNESDSVVTYRWKAQFVANEASLDLDGIYVVKFGDHGCCSEFYQWTVEKPHG